MSGVGGEADEIGARSDIASQVSCLHDALNPDYPAVSLNRALAKKRCPKERVGGITFPDLIADPAGFCKAI